ncbi:S-layer homology domain-containing protein [Agathobaculum sp.]|uniref:S-layer homology domain-containing protein n=1 Tax=Agathobaculum sp. TaxID=2048138 RepID=UPI003AF10BA1
MKKMWISALLAAAMMTAAGAADTPSAWAQKSVDAARAAGLVPSQVDSAFDTAITREDFCSLAAAVYRAWEKKDALTAYTSSRVSFSDTDNADVLLCASAGVVNGVGNGKFAPQKNITRQEAASMLYRLAALNKNTKDDEATSLPHIFADSANIQSWAWKNVDWVYRQGIMNGMGENTFAPDGEYTREQSIVTALRLYDSSYAVAPEAEAAHYVLVPNERTVTIEDAAGNRLLTDFEGTRGYFNRADLLGDWAGVSWQNDSGAHWAAVNMKTGETLKDRMLTKISPDGTKAWATQQTMNGSGTSLIIRADGTHGKAEFNALTAWSNEGKAIVRSSDGSITAIDNQTRELWRVKGVSLANATLSGIGDKLFVTYTDGRTVLVTNGKAQKTGIRNAVTINESGETYVRSDTTGYYYVCDLNGNAISRTYQNALYSVGHDLYAGWVKDRTYEYIYCPSGSTARVLYTVTGQTPAPSGTW